MEGPREICIDFWLRDTYNCLLLLCSVGTKHMYTWSLFNFRWFKNWLRGFVAKKKKVQLWKEMTTVLKSLSLNCCFPEKINSKFLLVFCFEIHWSVCKCHSLEINVRGGGGMDYTVRGILQATILEWVVFPFSNSNAYLQSKALASALLSTILVARNVSKF